MKHLIAILALAALSLVGCTVQVFGPAAKGQVVLSLGTPSAARAVLNNAGVAPRTLSLSSDLSSVTYRAINVASGAVEASGSVGSASETVTLKLTGGQRYRVVVEATPVAGGPGTATGVSLFGDEALVTVPSDGGITYAVLSLRPTKSVIFDNYVFSSSVNAITGDRGPISVEFNVTPQASPSDSFFYGFRGELYYFNRSDNVVYQWLDIGSSLDNSAENTKGFRGQATVLGPTQPT